MPNLSRFHSHKCGVKPSESRRKLASSGFTASVWTLSGVVLAACGLFDDDEGGGNALHVQRSPVQGARLYFDMNNDGVIETGANGVDKQLQDAIFPKGFVTDASGRASNIPAIFQGLPFRAVLDGAIDAETGDPLSDALLSIPDVNGYHRLASPITDLLADDSKTPEEMARELLPNADSAEITRILEVINNPRNYLGGHDGVEGFAFFLATEIAAGRIPTPTDSEVQSKAAQYLTDNPTDPNRDTLIVVNEDADADPAFIDLQAKTIGAHDSYVATIQAVSHAGAVEYRFVEADGTPADVSDFSINSQGIVSFIGENPTTATLHIEVSNDDDSETEIVRVDVTVADAPTLDELPAGDETVTIMENVAGAAGTGTALITGITTTATNPTWKISEANPAGMKDVLDKFDIVDGIGGTFNLVLKAGESLDYDAIPRGVLNLHLWAEENDIRSNALELRIQVEEDPDEVGFSGRFTGIVAEDGNLVAQGTISVENQPENEDVTISSQGTYGTLTLDDNGTWTYTLDDSIARVDGLLSGQTLIDIATISVGGIPQSIVIRINGADEDVHFTANNARTTTASVDVEFGNPVLSGVDIFNGLTLMNAALTELEVDFAETGGIYDLFTITDTGLLTFTGTNADVAGFGGGITLNLEITAPALTEATFPFALQVNVVNAVDDGDSQYEIIGDIVAGETLEVRRISEDPDGAGAVSIVWYRGDASTPTGDRGTTYRVTAADVGATIGAVITYIDGANAPESIDITASSVAFAPNMGRQSINMDEGTILTTTTLASVSATSKLGAAVSYELAPIEDHALFSVDGNGDISLNAAGAWDYESNKKEYVVEVIASAADGGGGTDTARARITFAVRDVNDNAPEFTQSTYTASIAETLAPGQPVGVTVAATDADGTSAHNQVSYSVTAGTGMGVFDVDNNGVITLLSALDYETATSYKLEITATDGSLTDTAMVEITITDINDIAPMLEEAVWMGGYASGVREDTPANTALFQITATDGDTATTPPPTLAYEIVSIDGVAYDAATAAFEIDAIGIVRLVAGLDYETAQSHRLIIRATDGVHLSDEESVTINVADANDHGPTLAVAGAGRIDERIGGNTDAISATGLTITLSDADATPTHQSTAPTFRVLNAADDTENTDYQVIDVGGTWVLQHTGATLDVLTTPTIRLKIGVSDGVNPEFITPAFTLAVNNVEEGRATYIIEGTIEAGQTLTAKLAPSGADPDGRVGDATYRWFRKDSGDADPTSLTDAETASFVWLTTASSADDTFAIVGNPVAGAVYGVAISYVDGFADGSTPQGAPTFVTALASALVFSYPSGATSYTGAIDEDGTGLTTIDINASLNDPDITDNITYAFVTDADAGTTSTTHLGFTINAGSGVISFTGTAGTDLDYETIANNPIPLIVRATHDNGNSNIPNPSGDISVAISVNDINESAPVFNTTDTSLIGATADVAEDVAVGYRVGLFHASDADGSNNVVSYTLAGGGGVFDVREVAGTSNYEIYVTDTANLDFDAGSKTYNLVITASDSDPDTPKTAEKRVAITITDINDNAPRVAGSSGTATLTEADAVSTNTETGYSITLADADTDAVNEHIFTILGGEDSRFAFVKDGATANQWNLVLLAGQVVDREMDGASIALNFQVTDGNNRPLTALSTNVAITDANDHAPTVRAFPTDLTPPIMPITLNERPDADTSRTPIVVEGLTIELDDADATTAHQSITPTSTPVPTFTVLNASDNSVNAKFEVVDDNGNWVLQYVDSVLDAISTSSFEVIIQVSDGVHTPPATSDPITITVINVDEGPTSFAVNPTEANDKILEVEVATPDPDGLNGRYSYQWFTTTDNGITQNDITGANGREFDTTGRTDPANTVYGVRVEYIDNADTIYSKANGNAPFAVNTTLRFTESYSITLTDGDDSPTLPVFALELNGVAVTTGATYDFATDGNPGGFFALSEAGVLTLNAAVDFDTATDAEKSFNLLIVATATGGETALAMIPVSVIDANDNAPRITATDDTQTATGALVDDVVDGNPGVSFKIIDADSNAVNRFGSEITSTTHASLADRFTLTFDTTDPTAKTAKLVLKSGMKIDREELGNTDTISLNVKVKDGQATSTDGVVVTLTITDINDNAPMATTSGTASLTEEVVGVAGGTKTGFSITLADNDLDATNNHAITIDDTTLASRFAFVEDGTTPNQWNLVLREGQKVDREADGETLTIAYTITDDSHTPITDSVAVSITDTNDNAPTMTLSGDSEINERLATDTGPIVAGITITITDADATAAHDSSVSGGPRLTFTVYDEDGTTVNNDYAVVRKAGGAVNEYQLQHTGDALNALATPSVALKIGVTDGVNPPSEQQPVTLNVNNVDEGEARYEVMGVVGEDARLTAMLVVADPDGVDASVDAMYRWFRKSSSDADPTAFDDAETASFKWLGAASTANTYTIDGMPVAGAEYGVLVSYKDGSVGDALSLAPAALAPTLEIAESSYSGSINEDGTSLSALDIDADVDGSATNISYAFVTDASTGATATTHLGFAIDSAGVINFAGPATDIDYDTDPPTTEINLIVRAIYDNSDSTTPNPFKDVDVAISVNPTNDHAPTMTLSGDSEINERLATDTGPIVAGITITIADADATAAHDSSVSGGPRLTFTVYDEDGTTVNNDYAVVRKAGGAVNEYQLQHTGDALNALATPSVALKIGVTDGVNPPSEQLPVTLNVNNVDEGEARYEVMGVVGEDARLTAILAVADPDGVDASVDAMYRWFRKSSSDADPTAFDDAETATFKWLGAASTANTYTIDGMPVAGAEYGVLVSYKDGSVGDTATFVPALASTLKFAESSYTATINEDGTSLSSLDIDAVFDGSATGISYAFVTDADAGTTATSHLGFTINAGSGVIRFTGTAGTDLDYETIANNPINLIVRATYDNGNSAIGDISVAISVNDINESVPVFNTTDTSLIGATADVPEDVAVGYRVGLFRATDADGSNNVVSYTLAGGGGVFDVREVAGTSNYEIYVTDTTNLDFDAGSKAYNLVITASDSDPDTPKTAEKRVAITITDANDNAPRATTSGTASLTEEALGVAGGTETGFSITLTDDDTDAVNNHAITIDDATLASRFAFVEDGTTANQWNLVLLEGQKVDREADGASLTIAYTITDDSNTPITDTIAVSIADDNDNAPMVAVTGTGAIDERIAGNTDAITATGLTITIADADATSAVAPTIRVLNAADDMENMDFEVVDVGGAWVLQLKAGSALNFEAPTATIQLKIEVSDGVHAPDVSDAFTLSVNNLQEGDGTFNIVGSVAPGVTLMADTTTNADPDGTQSITYQWYSVDLRGLNRNDLGTSATYDLGSNPDLTLTYKVEITHIDNLDDEDVQTLTASTVRFSSPIYTARIDEGVRVGLPDIDATAKTLPLTNYQFVTGNTLSDTSGIFAINSNSGVISLRDGMDLDYETAQSHNLIVRATAAGGVYGDVQAVIDVVDVNDVVPMLSAVGDITTGSVTEVEAGDNTDGEDTGITFTIDDADTGNVFKFSVVAATPNPQNDLNAAKFGVVDVGGVWTLRLKAGTALDREHSSLRNNPNIALVIKVNDGQADSNPIPVTINVIDANDIRPNLGLPVWVGSFGAGVSEDTAIDTKIFGITAFDGDADPTLTYEIVSINGAAFASITDPLFRINPGTGDVTIANALDYETAPQTYTLIIRASDGKHQSNEETVIINVTDVNEHAPMVAVTGAGMIDERISGNTDAIAATGLSITIADADATSAANPAPTIRVLNAADDMENMDFEVVDDAGTWVLQLKAGSALNFETPTATIALKIEVSDGVHTPDVSDAFTLSVNNLQEGAATYIVSGSIAADEELTAMLAPNGADLDGVDGTVPIMYRWFTKSSADANPASFATAQTATFQWLGTESTDNTYTIKGAPVANAIYGVLVRYTDNVPASTPNFVPALASALKFSQTDGYTATIKEDGTSPTALDIDAVFAGSADNISYAFLTDANTGATAATHQGFTIDAGSGVISFTGTASTDLDYETIANNPIILTVRATHDNDDSSISNPFGDIEVAITVGDLNDEKPVLDGAASLRINERTADGDFATGYIFTLTDADAVDDDAIFTAGDFTLSDTRFGVSKTATAGIWELVLKDGATLDYETAADRNIALSITVEDANGNTSTALPIAISVQNAPDQPRIVPNAPGSLDAGSLTENQLGVDTGVTFILEDVGVPISYVVTADATDIDPSSFSLAERSGTHKFVLDGYEIAGDGDNARNWFKLKLKDGYSADFEGFGISGGALFFEIRAHDSAGNIIARQAVDIPLVNVEPEKTPSLYLTGKRGSITENVAGADSFASFTLSDPDTAISFTETATTTDIDPSDFVITAIDGTHSKFASMFRLARNGTSDRWSLQLKEGVSLDYEDPDLPTHKTLFLDVRVTDHKGHTSSALNFEIVVNNVVDELPILSEAQGTGAITDNAIGVDTGITFTLSDGDTTISTTATADATDIDPDSFIITATGGYEQRYADVFEVVWDDTAKNWKLKLRDGSWIDYEDAGLDEDKILHFDIHVADPAGNKSLVRSVDVAVQNILDGPHIVQGGPGSFTGSLTENQLGVDTGITFIVIGDNADNTPISYTVTPDNPDDIDPSNLAFTLRYAIHRFAIEKYEIVVDGDGTNNWFKLKLKDGYAADYEGFGLNPSRTLFLEIRVHDNDGNIIARRGVDVQLHNVDPEVTPTLFLTSKYGSITENIVGVNSGAAFSLSDGDTDISFAETATTDDIDPNDFVITAIDGTHAKFAGMFRVARHGTKDEWSLQLKPGVSLDYEDTDLPAEALFLTRLSKTISLDARVTDPDGNVSSALNFYISVLDAKTPVLGEPQGTGAITENAVGADTGITFTFTDADTPISATATDDIFDIDPDSFDITARTGTDTKFADMFALAKTDTADIWKLKLKPGVSIDYEDTDLPTDKVIRLSVQITDPSGKASEIRNVDIAVTDDTTAPILGVPQGIGVIIENTAGADSRISFAVSDGGTLMTSPATAATTDIDPDSFTITARTGTNAKFASLFTFAYDATNNVWHLKLKERMTLDHDDTDLAADKIIRLTVQLTDPEGNVSATPRNVDIRVVDESVEAPVLSEAQGTGSITENAAGADSGITFTLTDPDTVISSTITASTMDIDPSDFELTTRDDTNAKFIKMFEFARKGTSNTWTLKLKPGVSIDYEDEDLDADDILQFSVQITDPTTRSSATRDIDISVENIDEIAPAFTTGHVLLEIMENEAGVFIRDFAGHLFTITATDDISPGVRGDLDASNIRITAAGGTDSSYVDYFEFIRRGTSDKWNMKLKDGFSLDYEGSGLIMPHGKHALWFHLTVIDDAGNQTTSHSGRLLIEVRIFDNDSETTPTLNTHLRDNVGSVQENVKAAYTGLRFTVTDPDTPISTTGRTAATTDIDPDSFTITARDDTHDQFADMFEVVREGTSDNWRIKLKDGVSLNYEDPDLPANKRIDLAVKVSDPEGNTSTTWHFHVDVGNANEAPPNLSEPKGTGAITENDLGADTGITFMMTDADTTIFTTATADTNDIDPNSFIITAADGYAQRYADLFEVVSDPIVTTFPIISVNFDNWKLKLRDGATIDYEDPNLHADKILHFDIHVTDPEGHKSAVRRIDIEVRNVKDGPHILQGGPGSTRTGSLTENQLGADTGITFIVISDDAANTPISYTVTPDTTDIDPSSFSIRGINQTHDFVTEDYEFVGDGDGTNNWFKLKLKDGYAADYEGFGLSGGRQVRFRITLTNPDGSTRIHDVRIPLVNIEDEVIPTMFLVRKFGVVAENVAGANTLASFTLSDDPDTTISTTRTPADTTDIDPNSFNIAVRDGTNAKFANMFDIAWDEANNRWTVKLKPGMSIDYDDADLPANKVILLAVNVTDPDGNVSSLLGLGVEVVNAAVPVLSAPQGTGAITEHDLGADTGITFTLTDADTTISTTATADKTDIDPNSFTITAAGGYEQRYANVFEVVWDATAKNWKLKLRDGSWIDYEDPDLHADKMLHFDIHVTDPTGIISLVRRVDVEVRNAIDGPHIVQGGPGSTRTGSLTENQFGADTGITFTLSEVGTTPISYTVTPDTTDIDPSSFSISGIDQTHRFVTEDYEIVGDGDGTNNWFKLKLKDGYAADYEGFGLSGGRQVRFRITLTNPDGSTRIHDVRIPLVNIEDEVIPTMFLVRKFGVVVENVAGANALASFTLSDDPDTTISTTRTPADTTDIDPSNFNIAVRDGTNAKFANMFDIAWDEARNRWTVKLKPGMSIDYDDADLPANKVILLEVSVTDPDGNVSSLLGLGVEVLNAIAPILGGAVLGSGEIIENAVGADTGITFTLTDADTDISATATDDTTDIDPNSFVITARTGTDAKFAGMFGLAKTYTADTWKLKLKPGLSIDYEDTDLPTDKVIQLSVQVIDHSGEASLIRHVDISVIDDTTAPILGAPQGVGAIAEGINGANAGISFAVSDGDTLMTSPATASTSDIDPDSFTITARDSTNAKFAALFTLAYDDANSIWRLKLKDTENISDADPDLAADKTIRLTIQLTDPEGTASATPRNVDIRVVDGGVEAPVLSEAQGTGSITENAAGADSGITFTLTDADTVISSTITANSIDIDPNDFELTARGDTNAKFTKMFEFVREDDTSDIWTLKLKEGMSLDYEDEDLDADNILQFSVRVTDPANRSSETRDIDITVENVDEIAPVIAGGDRGLDVPENVLGVAITSYTVTDETAPGVKGVLDSSNFIITHVPGIHRSYPDYFEFVREGTSDIWTLKLKDEFSLDSEAAGLYNRGIWLNVRVIDDAGNESSIGQIIVQIQNQYPETTPTLNTHLRYNVGTVTENVQGVAGNIDAGSTGLRFTVTDDDTPISTTGRTADTTDIDPDSFIITAQSGTNTKFADMFEVVREGTSNNWRIKLKDGVSLDYEDTDLPAPEDSGNKRLSFSVKVADPDGNTSTTWYIHVDVRDVDAEPAPAPAPAPAATPDDLEDLGLTPIPDTDPNG